MTAVENEDIVPSTIKEFVKSVVDGENGSGSVFLDGYLGDSVYVLGAWTDDDEHPSYESSVIVDDNTVAAAEKLLSAAGLNPIVDWKEWADMVQKWNELS